ncbi:hypothetical protein XENOCAPTIV_028325 [Xenoophorus captivus]|uniref:Uncharacterized protein n=1 Tax=Xenoophorus captivus TaxID=1517983 RepID=A0ABV0RMA4_9TELE
MKRTLLGADGKHLIFSTFHPEQDFGKCCIWYVTVTYGGGPSPLCLLPQTTPINASSYKTLQNAFTTHEIICPMPKCCIDTRIFVKNPESSKRTLQNTEIHFKRKTEKSASIFTKTYKTQQKCNNSQKYKIHFFTKDHKHSIKFENICYKTPLTTDGIVQF